LLLLAQAATARSPCENSDEIERRPIMEDMRHDVCYGAERSANGRQIQHTQAGLLVCCERALTEKRRRTDHARGVPARGLSVDRPRERSSTSHFALRGGVQSAEAEALHDVDSRWRRFAIWLLRSPPLPSAGELLPSDQQHRLALRAAATKSASRALQTHIWPIYLNIKHCVVILYH
jgi:hypothetical protein